MSDLTFTTQSQFLHHGIEGQKWGVQNGPPYPLDARRLKKTARSRVREARRNLYSTSIKKKETAALAGAIAAPIATTAARYKMMPKGLRKVAVASVRVSPFRNLRMAKKAVTAAAVSAAGYKTAKAVIKANADPSEKMEYARAMQELRERKEEYRAIKNFVRINSNKSLSPGEVEEVNKALQEYYNLVM